MAVALIVLLLMVLGAGAIALNGRRPWERVHRSGVKSLEVLTPPVPGPLHGGVRVLATRAPDIVVLAYRSSICDRGSGLDRRRYAPDEIHVRIAPDTRGCRDVFSEDDVISAIALQFESDIAGRAIRVECVSSHRCRGPA